MKTIPYLNFDGDCADAFRFYADVLGGEVKAMITHGDSPMAGEVPADWHHLVMHAYLQAGDVELFGGDEPPGYAAPRGGFMISLHVDSAADADRIFAALAEGGNVTMALDRTFWAERFGMLVDRFGTPWGIGYEGSVRYAQDAASDAATRNAAAPTATAAAAPAGG